MDENFPAYVISIAAQLSGLHPQTLRQYDRLGLVSPHRSGRYRLYSVRDIARLEKVQELSDAGLNLEGIRRVLELEDGGQQAARAAGEVRAPGAVDGAGGVPRPSVTNRPKSRVDVTRSIAAGDHGAMRAIFVVTAGVGLLRPPPPPSQTATCRSRKALPLPPIPRPLPATVTTASSCVSAPGVEPNARQQAARTRLVSRIPTRLGKRFQVVTVDPGVDITQAIADTQGQPRCDRRGSRRVLRTARRAQRSAVRPTVGSGEQGPERRWRRNVNGGRRHQRSRGLDQDHR